MTIKPICRLAALLSIALFMAMTATSFGQKTVPQLDNARFNQLLTTGDAATLRSRILAKPGARLGRKGVSETRSGNVNRKAVTVEVASQFFTTNDGEVEQISIRINEGGRERFWILSELNDRIVERLDGGGGVIADARACLDQQLDESAKCKECEANLGACSDLGIAQSVVCATTELLNPFGPCGRCGLIALFEALDCLVGGA